MIEVLDPLSKIPGVRLALLVAPDGVPVTVHGTVHKRESTAPDFASEDADSLAALATGWLAELTRSVGVLTWDAPQRVVLKAARGTLLMHAAPSAVILVVCERGTSPQELRVPMEAAVARMQRILRGMGSASSSRASENSSTPESALPSRGLDKGPGLVRADSVSPQSPHSPGQE